MRERSAQPPADRVTDPSHGSLCQPRPNTTACGVALRAMELTLAGGDWVRVGVLMRVGEGGIGDWVEMAQHLLATRRAPMPARTARTADGLSGRIRRSRKMLPHVCSPTQSRYVIQLVHFVILRWHSWSTDSVPPSHLKPRKSKTATFATPQPNRTWSFFQRPRHLHFAVFGMFCTSRTVQPCSLPPANRGRHTPVRKGKLV